MNVTVTPAAQKFISRMMRFDGAPGSGFRLVVTAGGCSGLSAQFTVDQDPHPGDAVVAISGIRMFLPAESRLARGGRPTSSTRRCRRASFPRSRLRAACGWGCPAAAPDHRHQGLSCWRRQTSELIWSSWRRLLAQTVLGGGLPADAERHLQEVGAAMTIRRARRRRSP
jgi:hypothetical protein